MNFIGIFLVCCLLIWILLWIGSAFLPTQLVVIILHALVLAILLNGYVDLKDRVEKLEKQLNPDEEEESAKDSANSPASSKT